MPSGGKLVFRLVGGVFFVIGLGLLGGTYYAGNRQYTILKSWPTAEAEVTRSEVVSYRDNQGTTMHRAAIDFRYTVNGKEYSVPSSSSYSSSSYSEMQGKVEKYAPGTRHTIKYNPANPSDMRFDVGYNFGFFFIPFILGVIGLPFTLIGGVLLVVSRKLVEMTCPSCGQAVQPGQNFCPNCSTAIPGNPGT